MSIYEGYLSFGGNEIVNNARTQGIARSAQPCPMHWLKGPSCGSMSAALFEEAPYSYEAITEAPWYDPDIPQSTDFFGFFAYSITEAMDSTRAVSRTESITDGGVLGRTRRATKTMRVRGLLMGRGRRAVEYGQAWLSAALDPGACGQHGTECGMTDVEWFADCPPDRGTVPEWAGWVETRRNTFPNPRVSTMSNVQSAVGTGGAATTATVSGATPAGTNTFRRQTTTTPPTAKDSGWLINRMADGSAPAGVPVAVSFAIRSSVAMTTSLTTSIYTDGVAGRLVNLGPVTLPANTWVRVSVVVPLAGAEDGYYLRVYRGNADPLPVAGNTLDIAEVMETATGDYFDGDMAPVVDPTTEKRYSWTGAVNASASVEETRSVITRPQTDEEYQATIDQDMRYLHDAAAISGPLIVNTLEAGDFMAYEVEIVFAAERPWVFGKSRDIDLPPTVPLVIQDIPYNLVPAPSAELAAGDVIAARNLAPNPSVETNANDWYANGDGSQIAQANVAGARSTALAAVGLASYRALFTAPAASTGPGYFYAQQTVPITDALERHSFNLWAALIPLAGTSAPDRIEAVAYWQNASNVTLRSDPLGVIDVAGGFVSVSGVLPPAGSAKVIVRAIGHLASWSSGATVQLFADAVAVTVP